MHEAIIQQDAINNNGLHSVIDTGFSIPINTALLKMAHGVGNYHTNNPLAKSPTPLLTIVWANIQRLVDTPGYCAKDKAGWFIPSTLPSRLVEEQIARGSFIVMPFDFDDVPCSFAQLTTIVNGIFGNSDLELYSTKSNTPEKTKARLIVRLAEPLNFVQFMAAQSIAVSFFKDAGIVCDKAWKTCSYIYYLPNAGLLYEKPYSQRKGAGFPPFIAWPKTMQVEISILEAEKLEYLAEKEAQQAAAQYRKTLSQLPDHQPTQGDLIGAFNAVYEPANIMLAAGYQQRNENQFRHPFSESGNYSASVQVGVDGLKRVNSLSTSDKLYSNGKGAHHAFSAFCAIYHNNDMGSALRDAGDNWLTIDGVSWNKAVQRKWAENKAAQIPKVDVSGLIAKAQGAEITFGFNQYSLNGESKMLKDNLAKEAYLMDGLVLMGQLTVWYAKPNAGKTLLAIKLIADAIGKNNIDASKIFYINADDTGSGLVTKIEFAEQYGFQMLAPGYKGFTAKDFEIQIAGMIKTDACKNTAIILDTLKKFTDLMSKTKQKDFFTLCRDFVLKGGTVVMLAHPNKKRDDNNKLIAGGTSDAGDDVDCVYILDAINPVNGTITVEFERTKCRGNNVSTASFQYENTDGLSWEEKFDSVTQVSGEVVTALRNDLRHKAQQETDYSLILKVGNAINSGINKQPDLLDFIIREANIGHKAAFNFLKKYSSPTRCYKQMFDEISGDKNSKTYSLHLL